MSELVSQGIGDKGLYELLIESNRLLCLMYPAINRIALESTPKYSITEAAFISHTLGIENGFIMEQLSQIYCDLLVCTYFKEAGEKIQRFLTLCLFISRLEDTQKALLLSRSSEENLYNSRTQTNILTIAENTRFIIAEFSSEPDPSENMIVDQDRLNLANYLTARLTTLIDESTVLLYHNNSALTASSSRQSVNIATSSSEIGQMLKKNNNELSTPIFLFMHVLKGFIIQNYKLNQNPEFKLSHEEVVRLSLSKVLENRALSIIIERILEEFLSQNPNISSLKKSQLGLELGLIAVGTKDSAIQQSYWVEVLLNILLKTITEPRFRFMQLQSSKIAIEAAKQVNSLPQATY